MPQLFPDGSPTLAHSGDVEDLSTGFGSSEPFASAWAANPHISDCSEDAYVQLR